MDIREHRGAPIVLVDEPDDGRGRQNSVPRLITLGGTVA
jgi:hypothetical protein